MGLIKRILGICKTGHPENFDCWNYSNNRVEIDLDTAHELAKPGGALRLEGKGLPGKILVINGVDEKFHAFQNRCTHIGRRRLDPVEGSDHVCCCSVFGSTFNYSGKTVSGPAKKNIKTYQVVKTDAEKLIITI